jgi:hypothetical protein
MRPARDRLRVRFMRDAECHGVIQSRSGVGLSPTKIQTSGLVGSNWSCVKPLLFFDPPTPIVVSFNAANRPSLAFWLASSSALSIQTDCTRKSCGGAESRSGGGMDQCAFSKTPHISMPIPTVSTLTGNITILAGCPANSISFSDATLDSSAVTCRSAVRWATSRSLLSSAMIVDFCSLLIRSSNTNKAIVHSDSTKMPPSTSHIALRWKMRQMRWTDALYFGDSNIIPAPTANAASTLTDRSQKWGQNGEALKIVSMIGGLLPWRHRASAGNPVRQSGGSDGSGGFSLPSPAEQTHHAEAGGEKWESGGEWRGRKLSCLEAHHRRRRMEAACVTNTVGIWAAWGVNGTDRTSHISGKENRLRTPRNEQVNARKLRHASPNFHSVTYLIGYLARRGATGKLHLRLNGRVGITHI